MSFGLAASSLMGMQAIGQPLPEPLASPAETPASETPASETPASETPALETPALETPASETPVSPTETSVPVPSLVVPGLPTLREFSRYLPENSTIHLVLRLSQRKVYVYQGKTLLASYPVAIGRPDYPTPTGEFKVQEMIVNPAWQSPWTGEVESPGVDGSLGLRWIGFTQVNNGVIGFHGTPNVGSIGRAVSHGCVRMRNEDIVKLYEQVKIGTMVKVEP